MQLLNKLDEKMKFIHKQKQLNEQLLSQNKHQQSITINNKQKQPKRRMMSNKISKSIKLQNIHKDTLNRIFNIYHPIQDNSSLQEVCLFTIGNLYIGGVGTLSQPILKKHQIRCVLSIMSYRQFSKHKINEKIQNSDQIIQHQWIDLNQDQDNLLTYFEHSFDFIDQLLRSNMNLLVHCSDGLARAPVIVVSYLMRKYKLKFSTAYEIVKEKRVDVSIHDNLKKQIQHL